MVFVCDYVVKSIFCTVGRCWNHERSGYWCSLKGSGLCATQKVGVRNRSTLCICESHVAWLWSADARFLPCLLVFDRTICGTCATNAGGAIQGLQTWTGIRPRYTMVKLDDDATGAGGVEETSLPVGDWLTTCAGNNADHSPEFW